MQKQKLISKHTLAMSDFNSVWNSLKLIYLDSRFRLLKLLVCSVAYVHISKVVDVLSRNVRDKVFK